MTEIVVVSGKGGTGKTSLTAAFAHLAQDKVVCDLDVDAPDLHILLAPDALAEEDFVSGHLAAIDPGRCTGCGLCASKCRYGAIGPDGDTFVVDPSRCEGCKLCVALCPERAVAFTPRTCGRHYVSKTRFGTMVHAQLHPGQENSGRLVTLLRRQAAKIAAQEKAGLILSDGSPGIGCPVIASLSGAGLAVAVTEPSLSGLHDLVRVAELCGHFRVPVAVVVNKHDLSAEATQAIEAYAKANGHIVAGRIPFDPAVTRAMLERKAVTETNGSPVAAAVARIWDTVKAAAPRRGGSRTTLT